MSAPETKGTTSWWRRWEAPTWAVALAVYAGYGLVTWYYRALPWWLVLPLGAWFVCWHGSLQHEALHGHPTRRAWLNGLIAFPPLWLWLPYPLYRESHLIHHGDAKLTAPGTDPESYYVTADAWVGMGWPGRALLRARNTLLGRLALGSAMAYAELAVCEVRRLRAGDTSHLAHWLAHVPAVAAVLYWALGVCGIPFWVYVACFAYPGLSLTMLRSYAEHRPAVEVGHRSAVVEAAWPFRLLFLNNNYHAPHHAHPAMPWYDLPADYRANRAAYLEGNGGYLFRGYGEQFRRFLLRLKDEPVHPF
ncbi:MAG: fatty acid desaturase [Alphaproteobacteria bacterium]